MHDCMAAVIGPLATSVRSAHRVTLPPFWWLSRLLFPVFCAGYSGDCCAPISSPLAPTCAGLEPSAHGVRVLPHGLAVPEGGAGGAGGTGQAAATVHSAGAGGRRGRVGATHGQVGVVDPRKGTDDPQCYGKVMHLLSAHRFFFVRTRVCAF
jgi:hypothetical protein